MKLFSKKITVISLIPLGVLIFICSFFVVRYNLGGPAPLTAQQFYFDEQEATVRSIKQVMPAVVSILVYADEKVATIDLESGKQSESIEKIRKGSGTGFLISSDGLIMTNKHVVSVFEGEQAEYRIILSNGKEYYAQLIGKDPLNDLAVLKIFDSGLPFVALGDSDRLEPGISVIAIGNALGLFQNSVTKGIISGIGRSVQASDQAGNVENLDNVIQTDAGINPGNSGGPLIDLEGKVIGINTALVSSGQSIGFAIPINDARNVIRSVKEKGLIIRPILGVRYIMLTPATARDNKLSRSTGAWITGDQTEQDIILPGSPAEKAGLQPNDIIFEINGVKLNERNTLLALIQRYKPGDRIGLKIQRGDKVLIITATLEEYK